VSVSERVWVGSEALEAFLVPIDSLEPFPGNPRRGDTEAVAASLRRFGQVRPILVDGARIVAGHHVVEAARAEGWTHISAIGNEFESEEEARAYLLADNRIPELGGFDEELLAVQLQALRENYAGTGYSKEDAEALAARLAEIRGDGFRTMTDEFDPEMDGPPRLDERQGSPGFFEVPLRLDRETRTDFARAVAILKREWELDDTTTVVIRAVREAAERS
jgi:ParB-like chromosome segregation protein Spo0J